MSGYSIKVTAFLPCGKNAAEHNIAFQKIEALHDALADIGCVEVDVIDEFKPNRKVPASRLTDDGKLPSDVVYGLGAAVPASASPAPAGGAQTQDGAAPALPQPVAGAALPNANEELWLVNDKRTGA